MPAGLKHVNNPWQDRVIDAFRQIDSRWGYNGKPTKSAAVDNNGVPVTAAGDEAAYHYSGGRRRARSTSISWTCWSVIAARPRR